MTLSFVSAPSPYALSIMWQSLKWTGNIINKHGYIQDHKWTARLIYYVVPLGTRV